MTVTADRPLGISTVCTRCGGLIKPQYLKSATQTRIDCEDGYRLQYDHDDCPGLRDYGNPDKPPFETLLSMLQ